MGGSEQRISRHGAAGKVSGQAFIARLLATSDVRSRIHDPGALP
jgi:hypothetical protein